MPGRRSLLSVLAAALMIFAGATARATDIQVAVAANFTAPAREIADAFAQATGHKAVLSFGASGQFYTQISQGAPFEVFLSADAERPQKAEQAGLAVAGTRFTYALGRLVLFSKTAGLVDDQGTVLKAGNFEKLAIADPAAAPYGVAAMQTMDKLGVAASLKPKLVTGQSIIQTYQFIATGAAELGFVALSQVVNETGGSRWVVPRESHAAIEQQAVLLKRGESNEAAKAFLAFLKDPQALAVIRQYGYEAD